MDRKHRRNESTCSRVHLCVFVRRPVTRSPGTAAMWRTCSSCMMTAASCHLAEKTPQYSSGRSWTQQQHQLVLLAFDFTAGAILPPQCKQNQLINSCSLCVYLLTTHYCLCVPRRIEYLTQTHWIQRYGPEKGPVKIWMWVYRKIVCQMIVDLTIGPTLTMSVATGVEQLSRLDRLWPPPLTVLPYMPYLGHLLFAVFRRIVLPKMSPKDWLLMLFSLRVPLAVKASLM